MTVHFILVLNNTVNVGEIIFICLRSQTNNFLDLFERKFKFDILSIKLQQKADRKRVYLVSNVE